MADETADLKEKIKELQLEVSRRDVELAKYRHELARTNQALEKLIIDLDTELKLAGKIQKILSPTEIPSIPGFEFSTKFVPGMKGGGDYFDIFEHEDNLKFGLLISSSSGYTMSALFLSVLMKFSGQLEARKGLSPEKVLERLGQEMTPEMQERDSVSIFYAVVDRRNFTVKYSSLGRIFCVHQIYDEDKLVQLEASGGPLSKTAAVRPLVEQIQLGSRDRLVLCTEGVLQAKGTRTEEFGKERLMQLLAAGPQGVHEMRNEILLQVESYAQAPFPDRDQTVLVTEVKDRVIKLAKKT